MKNTMYVFLVIGEVTSYLLRTGLSQYTLVFNEIIGIELIIVV